MTPTTEMLNAYIEDRFPWMDNTDRVRMFQGIAVYKHLESSASEQWRREHGFIKQDDNE